MNYIILTDLSGNPLLVNLDKVVSFQTDYLDGHAVVSVVYENNKITSDTVSESVEEILDIMYRRDHIN